MLGLDVDPQALTLAVQKLSPFGERVKLVQASYETLKDQLSAISWQRVDGILLDLGVSSMQLDTPERGFSFLVDAPLDMRFDPYAPFSAKDLINSYSEQDLAEIIYRYGEEKHARQIARKIVQNRPINTTLELANLIVGIAGGQRSKLHPATRTFQAIRIAF